MIIPNLFSKFDEACRQIPRKLEVDEDVPGELIDFPSLFLQSIYDNGAYFCR